MRTRRLLGGVLVIVLAAGCGSQHATTAGHAHHLTAAQRARVVPGIGTIPSWIPNPTPPANQVVTASPGHRVRAAIEGNTVIAKLPGGTADVTVVGPEVPAAFTRAVQSGRRSMDLPVPAKFIASFVVRTGTVRIDPQAFTLQTEDGAPHRAEVSSLGGGAAPAVLRQGQHVNLAVRATMVPGNGAVRWAPLGGKPLITWTYVLEVD